MKNSILKLFLVSLTLVIFSHAEVLVARYPLNANAPGNSCDEIIEVSSFGGNCCSLRNTGNGGCVLIVINGDCQVTGSIWTLNYTSTYANDDCPSSEYTDLMTGPRSAPATKTTLEDLDAVTQAVSGTTSAFSTIASSFLALVVVLAVLL